MIKGHNNNIELEEKRLKKIKGKSIESLFRTMSKNNHRMLQMVDRKSGILVSLNAIIISLLISIKSSSSEIDIHPSIPLIILSTSIFSLVFSLLAIRPFVISSVSLLGDNNCLLNTEAIQNKNINDYKNKVNKILSSDNLVYEAMTEDIFFIAKNINRKHKLLQLSAGIFTLGYVISGIIKVLF